MRDLTAQYGAVLIFDEVMTGFRVGLKSAQGLFGITPTSPPSARSLAAACRWGLLAASARSWNICPARPRVHQAGTLSGNPIATAAGLANVKLIQENGSTRR